MSEVTALIAAAGRGERFGRDRNKILSSLAGRPVIAHTVEAFERCGAVDSVVLVVADGELQHFGDLPRRFGWAKVNAIVTGGATRQESVEKGLAHVGEEVEIVAIHDGARPLVGESVITAVVEAARGCGAAAAAVPVVDTLKTADDHLFVEATPDRSRFLAVQTPQAFRREIVFEAYRRAKEAGVQATDDSSLVEATGHPVKLVTGSYENIKITTQTDLAIAEAIMQAQGRNPSLSVAARIGYGYDIHRFAEPGSNRKLFLGGVEFPGETGLLGHSDADVIIHAICDALLGAAGMGDIGMLYPNTDPNYAGVRSTVLLRDTGKRLKEAGWGIVNIDATAVAEAPRIAGRSAEMRKAVAAALDITTERISIKATTAEGLGALGGGEGIACTAVAFIIARV